MSLLTPLLDKGLIWFAEKAPLSSLDNSRVERLLLDNPTSDRPMPESRSDSRIYFGVEDLDSESGGLSLGAVHEFLYGTKKSDLPPYTIMSLLASKALTEDEKYIFWIGSDLKPSAFVLQKIPIKNFLKRNIFIAPPDRKSLFWATELALRSKAAGAVIAQIDSYSISVSKRFSLAAEKSGALGIITATTKLNTNSAAKTRWLVAGAPSPNSQERFRLSLLKNKGAKPAQNSWIVEVCDGDKALSLNLPGEMQKRSFEQDGLLGSKIYASGRG